MKIGEAVRHLQWRYGKFKTINVSRKDIQAINKMIEYVNTQTQESVNNNQIGYKLYLNEFLEQIKQYNATVLDPIPQKQLNTFFSKPLEWHEERFTTALNDMEVDRVTDGLGSETVKDLTPETVNDYIKRIKEGYEAFSVEEISQNMRLLFSETLRNFS